MSKVTVRMRTRYATAEQAIEPGKTGLVDAQEAKALVDGGYAVLVDAEGKDTPPRRITPGKTKTTPPASTPADGDEVPDASVTKVTEWVGDDRDRATRALKVEQERGDRARVSLVDHLTKMLNAEPAPGDSDGGEQQ
ncbi:hypothetical protein KIF24_01905 [Micromonospora sp. Llam7]|uniref:hypothetical protein n=1 Tax=Micromonospora tarapacensis TaxID=2835305 RepID=UPI001C83B298|nr:hypothetical protein [Micromonospora tarapacensis]MBX7264928.1 hypothetical protein [Micromonospora tarapacensis]